MFSCLRSVQVLLKHFNRNVTQATEKVRSATQRMLEAADRPLVLLERGDNTAGEKGTDTLACGAPQTAAK